MYGLNGEGLIPPGCANLNEWEVGMTMQRNLLLLVILASTAAAPVLAQTASAADTAAIPGMSGVWSHPALPWFEPPASGPGPALNKSRGEQRPGGISGSPASIPSTVA